MNYEQMSDDQLNTELKIALFGDDWNKEGALRKWDFNNPADAWPVIVENGISMIYDDTEKNWQAGSDFLDLSGCEGGGFDFLGSAVYMSNNPLRAAMIVFLMMQEGGK